MIFHAFLIKYAEIAIKGKNRYLFEDALVKQMKLALEPVEGEFTVTKEQGRVYVFCPEKYDGINSSCPSKKQMDRIGIYILSEYRKNLFFLVMCDIVNSAMKH